MKEDQANIFRVSIQQRERDRQTDRQKGRRKCKDTRQISVEKKKKMKKEQMRKEIALNSFEF